MNKKSLKTLSALLGISLLIPANFVNASKKSKSINSKVLPEISISMSSDSESSSENMDIGTPPKRNSPDLNLKRKRNDSNLPCKKPKTENDVNGGIYSIGNNCYINSLLQQLYDIDDFRNWILDFKINSVSSDETTCKKTKTIKHLFNRMLDKKWPDNYEKKLTEKMKTLGYEGYQEDPQELIQLIWADVFELFKSQKFKNINKNENFIFTNPLCVDNLNTSKTIQIPHTVSDKFILLINRTEFQKNTYKKNTTILNLKDILLNNPNYKITGVITHEGNTITRGHYLSYKYNKTNQKWYSYNDSIVKEISEASVLKKAATNATAIVFTNVSKD